MLGEEAESKVVFIIDDIESHLYTEWQNTIIPSFLQVMNVFNNIKHTQIIATTQSSVIENSVRMIFDSKTDALFNIDMVDNKVTVAKMSYES